MGRLLVVLVVAAGCGRIGFDPTGDVVDGANAGSDGPPASSCKMLAPTCGPLGNGPCCESPTVTGGTFYRSYDVAGDGQYPDMGYPATVSSFRLDKYEVTVGRFRQFVDAGMGTQASPPPAGAGERSLGGMPNQGGWDPSWNVNLAANTAALVAALRCTMQYPTWTWTDTPGGDDSESRPIGCITWFEAMAFCAWDGGFLPTETEWNYAAAGGSQQRAYPWSSPPSSLTNDDSSYASYYVDATKTCYGDMMNGCAITDLVRVGSKPAGDGLWGQSDFGGNVWTWTLDWNASTYANPCDDCANLVPASDRVVRGGGFPDSALFLRAGLRNSELPIRRFSDLGVRCARKP